MDPEVYLQPDFDPAKHKMADLRNILLQNDVPYPSSARKQHLVDLFNEHIKPFAEQKLKELNSVVAMGDGIEIVEKKGNARRGRSKTPIPKPDSDSDSEGVEVIGAPEKTSARTTTRTTATRRSPRRVAQSDVSKKPTRIASGDLKDIPKLEAESPEPSVKRERSRSREQPKLRDRSPRRVASGSSSRRRVASSAEKSPAKVKEDTEKETEENVRVSPFKVDPKLESSFSHDNVFQSPIQSSPDFKKVIPKKRGKSTESPEKELSKKNPRVLKKTAFSSSPAPQRSPEKSPLKKSLAISKFEDEDDSFSEKFKGSKTLQFDNSNEKSIELTNDLSVNNSDIASDHIEDNLGSDDVFHVSSDGDQQNNTTVVHATDYATPQSGNASRISIPSSIQGTPSRASRVSYSKAQSSLRENLTSWFKKTPKAEDTDTTEEVTEGVHVNEDPEQLEEEHESEEEQEASMDVLQSLQNEIESVYESVVNETNEAVKQVNDLFKDEDVDAEGEDETETKVKSKLSLSIPWRCIFNFLQKIVVFIILCVLVVGGLWYREQRVLIGYCGSEIDVPTFPYTENVRLQQLDDFLQDYKPQCLKCPQHAICLPKLTIKCKEDYIVEQPWYKFYNIFPFPDYCVKDHEKENAISEVVAKSLDLLRTRNAAIKCGDGDDLEVGISDDELYEFFYNSKKSSISDEEFDNIWSKVLEDLEKEPEITVRIIESSTPQSTEENIPSDEAEEETVIPQGSSKVIFRSNSSLKLSISCKFKKEVYERFEENKYYVTGVLSSLVIFTILYLWYSQYQQRQSKIREVSAVIISKLQKQQSDAIKDTTGLTNRYLSTIQLRDELLAQVRSKEKFNIWASILSQVEKNSNVRSSSKEIHGDIVRVLEWIGE